MNDNVNHPKHYEKSASGHECIEFAELLEFNRGNAFKYAWRAYQKHNSPVEDLKKCEWYLERCIKNKIHFARPFNKKDIHILDHEKTGSVCFMIYCGDIKGALKIIKHMIAEATK